MKIPNLASNLNQTIFDPSFGKNCQNWQFSLFASFRQFFWPKVGQMLFDPSFEARFGFFCHHLASLRKNFDIFPHFDLFTSHVYYLTTNAGGAVIFFRKCKFR